MGAGQSWDVNPTVPQGSETLKLGDDRIRNLATGFLRALGFDGASDVNATPAPFGVDPGTGLTSVIGDPVTPLGIATAQFAGRKALFANVGSVGNDHATYAGSTTPTFTVYDENAVYIILNGDDTQNSGAATLQLNGQGIVPLVRADGSSLLAGSFLPGTIYFVVWDTANFRIINYLGEPLLADPTTALQAATKQYADATLRHPVSTPIPTNGAGGGFIAASVVDVLPSPFYTVTTPNDGNNYLVQVSYAVWLSWVVGGEVDVAMWVEVNGSPTALGFAPFANPINATTETSAIMGSAISPIIVPANTLVTVKLKGQALGGGADVHANGFAGAFPTGPASYLSVTLVRTN